MAELTTEELFARLRNAASRAAVRPGEWTILSDLSLLEQRMGEMEEDAERSGFRVARKFMKDGGSPEWAPEGTIDSLRAQRDEAVAALARTSTTTTSRYFVHDGHTEGLVADKRRLEAQRDEAVSLLRGVLTAVLDVAGNLSTYSTQEETVRAATDAADAFLSRLDEAT